MKYFCFWFFFQLILFFLRVTATFWWLNALIILIFDLTCGPNCRFEHNRRLRRVSLYVHFMELIWHFLHVIHLLHFLTLIVWNWILNIHIQLVAETRIVQILWDHWALKHPFILLCPAIAADERGVDPRYFRPREPSIVVIVLALDGLFSWNKAAYLFERNYFIRYFEFMRRCNMILWVFIYTQILALDDVSWPYFLDVAI